MRKKLMIAIPLLAVVVGVVAFKALAPKPVAAKPKIDGDVYVLAREFLVNLDAGRYAKLGVALVLHHDPGEEKEAEAEAAKPPEGYGPLAQEAVVRAIVTDALTGQPARRLISADGRGQLKRRIQKAVEQQTDVRASSVLFTDVAVQ